MGHEHSHVVVDGEVYDSSKIKQLIPKLQSQVKQSQAQMLQRESDYERMSKLIELKDKELAEMKEELDKLRSVLQQKVVGGKPDILSTIQEEALMFGQDAQNRKKQGVSGESRTVSTVQAKLQHYDKDFSSKHLIKTALKSNDFLKKLDKNQILEMVNCMFEENIKKDEYIIQEGEAGNHLYVLANGNLEVLKQGKAFGQISTGKAFGELAILYGCTRTASVRALQDVKVWVLQRNVFQAIMMRTGIDQQKERLNFLKSVESLKDLGEDKLAKITDVLEVEYFKEGEHILREGQVGDTFYIISEGTVKVTKNVAGQPEPQHIRDLGRGEYFGEKALLTDERRTASVQALGPGVELLALNREAFVNLIGSLREFHEKDYGDIERQAEWTISQSESSPESTIVRSQLHIDVQFQNLQLSDLEIITTLGIGGFGRVELVRIAKDRTKTFALKCLKKQHIVETRQQEHVFSEKRVMMTCNSPFIVRLYKTFKDNKFVYMLMEVCLGGELWSILRDRGHFDDITARFCVACVLMALQYLHSRGIVYRDLKPENLLVTADGYIKMVDFGFAKQLPSGKKTWTFCGTPEYVAPEVILNKGHDHAVDIWAIGILVFELTAGIPPFNASDPMKTYNLILRGIDGFEFPKKVSKNAQAFIRRLCQQLPTERLGYQRNGLKDITRHKWFQGFDWEGLENRTLTPPFKRKTLSPSDASNFDRYSVAVSIPNDELSGWDVDF